MHTSNSWKKLLWQWGWMGPLLLLSPFLPDWCKVWIDLFLLGAFFTIWRNYKAKKASQNPREGLTDDPAANMTWGGMPRLSATYFRSGKTKTTKIGYLNRNGQRNHGTRGFSGNLHGQFSYKIVCQRCSNAYGANGSDIHLRRCPYCQGGAPGLNY